MQRKPPKIRSPQLTPLEKRLMLDASLPTIAGQVLWLDAADATTVRDADGDNAATGTGGSNNGFSGTVRTWVDKSGSGFNVTNNTAAQQPVYNAAGLNGKGVLTFDGTNDRLTNAGASITGNDYTAFIVFNRTTAAARDAVFELGNGGSRNAIFINDAGSNRIGYYVNSTFYNSSSTYTAGTYEVVSVVHDITTASFFRNGASQFSGTTLSRAGTTGIFVGDDSSGGDELQGNIAEIIVYDRDLTSDERHDVENYLASKWNLTTVNTAPVLATNAGATVSQSDPVTITSAMLNSTDADNTDSLLRYTITDLSDYGTITNTNTLHTYTLGEYFTQGDINSGYIRYTHGGTANFTDSFSFTVTDQYATTAAATFNLTITPDNIAPQFQGWTLVSSEDFQANAAGWSDTFRETSNPYLTTFLGRHSLEGGAQNTYKTYTMTGTQDYTVLSFDMYKLDSWDGEFFRVFINDSQVINLSMTQGSFQTFADGASGAVSYTVQELTPFAANFTLGGWNDQIIRFTLTIQNSAAATLKLGFSSTLDQATSDESWGVDNINIYEVNEGGTVGPFGIAENSANGTVVGRVTATDADVGQTITYSIAGGTGVGIFSINATTGVVTVVNGSALNYESTTSYTLDIVATDNGTPVLTATQTMTINILNLPENTAPTIAALGPLTVAENAANNTVVGTALGTDAEGNTITYSITAGNTDNIFAINSTTGQIRVSSNTNLNYEWDNSYTLTIQAIDNGFGTLSSTRNVIINISDINEAPTFNIPQSFLNQNPYLRYNATTGNFYQYVATTANYAAANTAAGAALLNGVAGHLATITSAAENTYVRALGTSNLWLGGNDSVTEGTWVWAGTGPEGGQTFWLGAAAGSAQNGFYTNWLTANPDNGSGVEDHLEMQASGQWNDAQNTVAKSYVIEWEGSAVLAALGNGPFTMAENPTLGQVVGSVHARDADAGDVLAYSITGGTGAALFSVNSSTGQITVSNPAISYEAATSYTLNMRVQDAAGLFNTQTVTINITDVNEAPVLSPAGPFSVTENTAIGTLVATMSATDDDGPAQTLTYSIASGNTDNIFAINSSTGAITIANNPNYELGASYNLTIRATDNGTGALFDSEVVTINITDVNEAPVLGAAGPFTIAENTAAGTLVTTMSATDDDGHTITYSITGGNGAGVFAINSSTGAITLATSPNYEAGTAYNLTITATDNGTGALTDTEIVTVNITNVNETPVLNPGGPFTVTENAANNTLVGTMTASDPDAATTLTYSITAGDTRGVFSINNSGEIRVARNIYLDYELAPTYTLTVRVSDGTLTASRSVVINLSNVNEAPSFDAIQRVLNADPTLEYNATTGNFYRYVATTANYATAQSNAAAATINGVAGYVTAINSAAENTFVRTLIPATIWINGSDAAVEGEWRYTGGPDTGEMFWLGTSTGSAQNGNYENFGSGEPNNSGGNEDGIEFTTAGVWNDTNVSGSRAYVIEWDGAAVMAGMQNTPHSIDENSALNSVIGTIRANDPEGGAVVYFITGGTGSSIFSLDANTGQIRLNAAIDHEAADSYTLQVRAEDPLGSFDTITVTININDLNEAPVLTPNGPFAVSEAAANNTLVGTMSASDVDDGQSLTYSIVGGNTHGIFSINNAGEIRVSNNTYLDYELLNTYTLQIRVTDNGTGNLFDQENVTVNLTNVNEGPSFDPVQRILNSDPTLRYDASTGNFYRFVTTNVNLATAQANSAAAMLNGIGGYLANINSSAENSFVRGISRDVIWIGGSDLANEGQWIYTQGPDAGELFWVGTAGGTAQNGNYTNWGGGEPNDSGGEDGIEMRNDGLWNDMNVGVSHGYVIEWNGADVIASLQHGPYNVPEHSAVNFNTGTALANDPDASSVLAYSITGGTGSGLFSISAAGVIRLIAPVNYEVVNSYTLDLRVQDSGGLFDTMTVTIDITDQNDVPSILTLTGNHITENSGAGVLIGLLSTADEDPADTHIYTMLTNPSGKFTIVGNELRTAADIDYEQNQSFTITLRVDDGNGGIRNRAFVIQVDNVMDTNTPPPATNPPMPPDAYTPPEEEQSGTGNILGASLGGEQGQSLAFYGEDGLQVLRENITFEIREILGLIEEEEGKAYQDLSSIAGAGFLLDIPEEALPSPDFTNIREALHFLQQMADSGKNGEEAVLEPEDEARLEKLPNSAIDRQFVDVMTYHQDRAARLREALMG